MTPRTQFLDLVRRRTPKYSKKRAPLTEQLTKLFEHDVLLTEALDTSSLQGIKFAIIGGHGLNLHGISRMTHDIDLMMEPANFEKAKMMLGGGQHTNLDSPRPDRPISGISFQTHQGFIYDLIWIDQPWAYEAIQNTKTTGAGPILRIPYMLMSKLWAGRGMQDDTDITNLIKQANEQEVEQTKELVRQYLPSDSEDFDQMIEIAHLM
jgi:hypothetical protein